MSRPDFPSTSIGRTQGRLLSSPSQESPAAHPLLSPSHVEAPRYVPYTPRQRVPTPAATTTGTTLALPSLSSSASDATSKLQLMNLKAATQNIGLDTTSVGWAILEKLVFGEAEHYPEWTEIWTLVTSGKATLLLPLEPLPSSSKITLDLVKDHVVLCEGASRRSGQIITLSGLRGTLNDETLTIRSSLAPSSKVFQKLLATSVSLTTLPPLPLISSGALYPSFSLPSYTSSLPLPPRPPPLPPRPSNTTRSPSNPNSLNAASNPGSRLPNPFASLFGNRSLSTASTSAPSTPSITTKALPSAQTLTQSPLTASSSPSASEPSSLAPLPAPSDSHTTTTVCAFTVSHRLVFSTLAREVCRALKTEVKDSLQLAGPNPTTPTIHSPTEKEAPAHKYTSQLLPQWIIDKVHEFSAPLYPFLKPRRRGQQSRQAAVHIYVPNPIEESSEELAEMVQEFYATLEGDLRERGMNSAHSKYSVYRRKRDAGHLEKRGVGLTAADSQSDSGHSHIGSNPSFYSYDGHPGEDDSSIHSRMSTLDHDQEKSKEKAADEDAHLVFIQEDENDESERRIRGILEVVEKTITELFYDRLFHLPVSDDASHDEALSSRIAALNMLDLGLDHLDISIAGDHDGEEEVNRVINVCGQALSRLDSCRSPASKAAFMVEAHKIVVNGLSQLPPIRLKSELEEMQSPIPTLRSPPLLARQNSFPATKEAATPEVPPAVPEVLPEPQGSEDRDSPVPSLSNNSNSDLTFLPPKTTPLPQSLRSVESTDVITDEPTIPTPSSLLAPPTPGSSALTADSLLSGTSSTLFTEATDTSIPQTPYSAASTTISGDVLFPLIIFSVVKANPPQFVSNLLFTQRFRNRSVGGEESYCLINLMAVAEFLENVDMGALGLEGGGRVMPPTANLTPIPVMSPPLSPQSGTHQSVPLVGNIRTQVDSLTAGAGKVFTGVVDSSFGMLKSLIPNGSAVTTPAVDGLQSSAPWNSLGNTVAVVTSPKSPILNGTGFGLLKREGASGNSGFGIQSILGIVPGVSGGDKDKKAGGEELVEVVSRPASIRSRISIKLGGSDLDTDSTESDDDEENADNEEEGAYDTRSIKSFESMMSSSKSKGKAKKAKVGSQEKADKMTGSIGRKSLTDRLASAAKSSPASRTATLPPQYDITPASSRSHSPTLPHTQIGLSIPPPNSRFLDCTAGDLRISEVEELLADYRRLVDSIRGIGGFAE